MKADKLDWNDEWLYRRLLELFARIPVLLSLIIEIEIEKEQTNEEVTEAANDFSIFLPKGTKKFMEKL